MDISRDGTISTEEFCTYFEAVLPTVRVYNLLSTYIMVLLCPHFVPSDSRLVWILQDPEQFEAIIGQYLEVAHACRTVAEWDRNGTNCSNSESPSRNRESSSRATKPVPTPLRP